MAALGTTGELAAAAVVAAAGGVGYPPVPVIAPDRIHGMPGEEFEVVTTFKSALKNVWFGSVGDGGYNVDLSIKRILELIQ